MTTTKKAAAKVASKITAEPAPQRVVLPHVQAWADARDHIRVIDAQTGPDAALPAREAERLAAERAEYVDAQDAAEKALA